MDDVLDLDRANALRKSTHALVSRGRGQEALRGVRSYLKVLQEDPGVSTIACASGCSFCCHLPVFVTLPEAQALVERIRRSGRLEEVLGRLRSGYAQIRGLGVEALALTRVPCSLLDGNPKQGQCSVYEDRPIACRTFTSPDVSRCEATFDLVDVDAPHPSRPADYMTHLLLSSGLAGESNTAYELRGILLAILLPDEPIQVAGQDVHFEP